MEMLTLDFMCLNGSVTFKSGSGADDESTGMGSVYVFHRIDLCHFSNISQWDFWTYILGGFFLMITMIGGNDSYFEICTI